MFITAYGDERTRARALRDGAFAFLKKPFEERALLDGVTRALRDAPLGGPDGRGNESSGD